MKKIKTFEAFLLESKDDKEKKDKKCSECGKKKCECEKKEEKE